MDRFLAFGGLTFYPRGGFKDFVGYADTAEHAKELLKAHVGVDGHWWHILDLIGPRVVDSSEDLRPIVE